MRDFKKKKFKLVTVASGVVLGLVSTCHSSTYPHFINNGNLLNLRMLTFRTRDHFKPRDTSTLSDDTNGSALEVEIKIHFCLLVTTETRVQKVRMSPEQEPPRTRITKHKKERRVAAGAPSS